jgi:hypothetical protein
MKKIRVEKTKKGFAALWESGGGYKNTGEATIVTDKDGQPKKSIYVRRRGELANGEHALIPIFVGDHIIESNQHRGDFEISIYRITGISKEEASIEKIAGFSNDEWDAEFPDFLEVAVQVAMIKATCYHCRAPHYIKT